VAEVAYSHVDHTREDGTPAHGSENAHSKGQKSAYEPRMSKPLKDWILKHLIEGFTSKQVHEEHKRNWIERRKHNMNKVRDNFVDLQDIVYYE
jgi:hypothetical protein